MSGTEIIETASEIAAFLLLITVGYGAGRLHAEGRIRNLQSQLRRYKRSEPLETLDGKGSFGDLYRVAMNGNGTPRLAYVRPATKSEAKACLDAYELDGGAGVFARHPKCEDWGTPKSVEFILPGHPEWDMDGLDYGTDLTYWKVLNVPEYEDWDAVPDPTVQARDEVSA